MSTLLIEDLRRQVAQRQIAVIFGTGVSVASTNGAPTAAWKGLLLHGIEQAATFGRNLPEGWRDRQLDAINRGDLDEWLGVAEQIARRLGAPKGGEYSRWLREAVGTLPTKNTEVIDAMLTLRAPLLTTNYDGLAEARSGRPPVTWRDTANCGRVLRGDTEGVIHLHGYWQEPESVIFGIRSYEQILASEHTQVLLRSLRTFRSLLFVGFGAGLLDPNFGPFLKWTERVFHDDEYRHYRLVKDGEVAKFQAEHRSDQRIFVLGFGDDNSKLPAFLRSLAPSPHV